jgi:hypothetical protein
LRCLLALAPPAYHLTKEGYFRSPGGDREGVRRTWAVLGPLHRLAFPAFVTGHRFLTDDFLVEETRWSNGARVVVNQRTDDGFEADDIVLPPLGFVAEHAQMVAHDALRYGSETFAARAWRVTRSRDDKPLAESADVLRQEFAV